MFRGLRNPLRFSAGKSPTTSWPPIRSVFYQFQPKTFYRAFHVFGQAKFAYGGLVLGSSQFTLLPQLPLKMTLNIKAVKIDSKIIISLP
jgi:hypothetical protein